MHLLGERLEDAGGGRHAHAGEGEGDPWVPAELVAELALHDWPGNVRELSNVTLHFVLENRERARGRITDELRRLLQPRSPSVAPEQSSSRRETTELDDRDILEALRAEKFSRPRAARRLGVSKSYFYKRLQRLESVRPADHIPPEEIRSALDAAGGDVGTAAERLEISTRALLLQMRRVRPS